MTVDNRRVLVTGGGTFLGDNIAAALLADGAEVTLLVRPGSEDKLGPLGQRVHWRTADVWDSASLKGRARGHGVVIHTIGSMVENPAQGLTYHRLNFVSARNVVTMCVSDGVPHMILLSSVYAPWVSRRYVRAKREAERYLARVGVNGTIIRAPITYQHGQSRPLFFEVMTALGSIPPLSWTRLGRIAPMPVDMLARGVARIALDTQRSKMIYYAPDLRQRNRRDDLPYDMTPSVPGEPQSEPHHLHPFELLDDESPFGWMPSDKDR